MTQKDTNYQNFTRFSQFQALRKTNPTLYASAAFQSAMHALAEKYGTAFFETPQQPRNPDTGQFTKQERTERIQSLREQLEQLVAEEGDSE